MTAGPNPSGSDHPGAEVSAQVQQALDEVHESHAEQPEVQVRHALEQHLRNIGVELGDDLLDRMAAEIAAGNPVDLGSG